MTSSQNKSALIIGATSALGIKLSHRLAEDGYSLILTGRDSNKISRLQQDITSSFNTQSRTLIADLMSDNFLPEEFVNKAGEFDSVFFLVGGSGNGDVYDLDNIENTIKLNLTMPAQILALISARMAKNNNGNIVIISSITGDRARACNYPYCAAKAGLNALAAGMRARLYKSNVHVLTVKPGFVGSGSRLSVSPDYAIDKILSAYRKRKNVVYVPFFWRYIMLIITHIPENIFKKLGPLRR